MTKYYSLMIIILIILTANGCSSERVCHEVFEEKYCVKGEKFYESNLNNFSFIKLKGNEEFEFHEIWIPQRNESLPDISKFKNDKSEFIFRKKESYRDGHYKLDTFLTREGKKPVGFFAIFVSKGSKVRGVAFLGPDKEKVQYLYESWLNEVSKGAK